MTGAVMESTQGGRLRGPTTAAFATDYHIMAEQRAERAPRHGVSRVANLQ